MDLLGGKTLHKADGTSKKAEEAIGDKDLVCYYFSAHWCPPCRNFTPILKDFYEEVEDKGVEVVFISSDRSDEDMMSYMKESHGDWWAVEYNSPLATQLKQTFGITGIPTLVVVKRDGTLVTKDGRSGVQGTGPSVIDQWKK